MENFKVPTCALSESQELGYLNFLELLLLLLSVKSLEETAGHVKTPAYVSKCSSDGEKFYVIKFEMWLDIM